MNQIISKRKEESSHCLLQDIKIIKRERDMDFGNVWENLESISKVFIDNFESILGAI